MKGSHKGRGRFYGASGQTRTLKLKPKIIAALSAYNYWRTVGFATRRPLGTNVQRVTLGAKVADALLENAPFDLPITGWPANPTWVCNPYHSAQPHIKTMEPSLEHLAVVAKALFDNRSLSDLMRFPFSIVARFYQSSPHDSGAHGPQSWHRDGSPPFMGRGILYLTDVRMDAGPFQYEDSSSPTRTGSVCAPAGTLVVFDANRVTHRAMIPLAGIRKVVDLAFVPRRPWSAKLVIWPGMNAWPKNPTRYSTEGMKVLNYA